ncbi:hypothetical protein AC739_08780 [Planococcus glaciei]|uniref:Acyl carrier protein n=2 Tax=Caryophanaceae TaxID=186818 RepID=A0A7H8QFF3_9BACL|nr:hypothetical protein AC739_08780 [Planococcus glaciei]QDY46844.1 acyl carrier protein [Planococcus glaciei]QKX52666.1 acyl carrier protein [Planococcus glaciei]
MMEVKEILRNYLKEEFEIEDDPDFTDDAHLFDMGFLDSLGATQVILFIEEEFNIEITQKDLILHPMNTVDEITLVIEEKLN